MKRLILSFVVFLSLCSWASSTAGPRAATTTSAASPTSTGATTATGTTTMRSTGSSSAAAAGRFELQFKMT